jgi:hypothetical protein
LRTIRVIFVVAVIVATIAAGIVDAVTTTCSRALTRGRFCCFRRRCRPAIMVVPLVGCLMIGIVTEHPFGGHAFFLPATFLVFQILLAPILLKQKCRGAVAVSLHLPYMLCVECVVVRLFPP